MKNWGSFIALLLAICVFCATQAIAAEKEMGKMPATTVQGQAAMKTAMAHADRVSMIMGKKALSQKGEALGKIEDMVLTKEGCLDYIVLAPEGWFGGGDRYIPIPWKLVKAGVQEDTIIIDRDRSQLEKAPAIEKGKWPHIITDNEWYGKVKGFFEGMK
jgi:sporulation protein YlmC with PRC-barrel domain